MDYPKFSVLMSLYYKEKPEYFAECMDSLLRQSVLPSEIVIVFDGPLTEELYNVVDHYIANTPDLIKTVKRSKNEGLGIALAAGVPKCSYDLIARMDTDDIARDDRFEKQLQVFINNPEVDICGSYIVEFEANTNNVLSKRHVPIDHAAIVRYQKQRSAFNHMTVMYKKQAVLRAGNYKDALLMEDDLLWVNMILSGAKCCNIPDYLVYARTGRAMIDRRGGFDYFKKYCSGRTQIYKTGFISKYDYLKTIIVQLIISLLPNKVRQFIFIKFLRHTG